MEHRFTLLQAFCPVLNDLINALYPVKCQHWIDSNNMFDIL